MTLQLRRLGYLALAGMLAALGLVTLARTAPARADEGLPQVTISGSAQQSTDTVVLDFTAKAPVFEASEGDDVPGRSAKDGSPFDMPGSHHFVYLRASYPSVGMTGQNPQSFDLPNVKSVVISEDYEGSLEIDLGLDHAASYTVRTVGNQVRITVAH